MKKILLALLVSLALLPLQGSATATKATAASVTCPATGSSIQVLPAAASRESFLILNTSGVTVRVGFLAGSSTAALTDSNSVKLLAGQNFSDAAPSIFVGRIVCAADGASPATVYAIETRKP